MNIQNACSLPRCDSFNKILFIIWWCWNINARLILNFQMIPQFAAFFIIFVYLFAHAIWDWALRCDRFISSWTRPCSCICMWLRLLDKQTSFCVTHGLLVYFYGLIIGGNIPSHLFLIYFGFLLILVTLYSNKIKISNLTYIFLKSHQHHSSFTKCLSQVQYQVNIIKF